MLAGNLAPNSSLQDPADAEVIALAARVANSR